MRKEDYQSNSGLPVDIVFVPEALHIDFKEKIKLQIAFYRNNKVCKSSPAKFLKENCKNSIIKLQPQKLQFCTTLSYDNQSKHFQSKIINVQVAFQTNASKQTLEGQIDLKDILVYQPSFQQSNLIVNFKNDIKLFYKVIGKIANYKTFQQEKLSPNLKKTAQRQLDFGTSNKKSEQKQKQIAFRANQQKQNENIRRSANQKSVRQKQLEVELEASQKKVKNLDDKLREAIRKFDDIAEENTNLKMKLKQSQSSLQQKHKEVGQMQKLMQRVTEQKNTLLNNLGKGNIQQQQAFKKLTHQVQKLNNEINVVKQLNNEYKNKISELKKSQSEITGKYQESQRRNLTLIAEIQEIKYKLQKSEKQQQKYVKKIEKMEKQISENGQSGAGNSQSQQNLKSMQADIVKLSKILQTKQEVIRMLKKQTQIKNNEQNDDLNILKKQNKDLKQQIQKLKDPKKDATYLELKVLNERLKKQSTEAKRQQKKMLAEKAEIQNKSKQMHQEIVRLKEAIGRMLNVVQEEGSSQLFTQVADCVS